MPIQAVFTGTSDVQPAIDLTQAEMELFMTGVAVDYWSAARTLSSGTVTVKLDLLIENWNGSYHTYTGKVHVGGTTYTPNTTVDTPDPQVPTSFKRELTFTVTSTQTYSYEIIGTTTAGYGFPLLVCCYDFAY